MFGYLGYWDIEVLEYILALRYWSIWNIGIFECLACCAIWDVEVLEIVEPRNTRIFGLLGYLGRRGI